MIIQTNSNQGQCVFWGILHANLQLLSLRSGYVLRKSIAILCSCMIGFCSFCASGSYCWQQNKAQNMEKGVELHACSPMLWMLRNEHCGEFKAKPATLFQNQNKTFPSHCSVKQFSLFTRRLRQEDCHEFVVSLGYKLQSDTLSQNKGAWAGYDEEWIKGLTLKKKLGDLHHRHTLPCSPHNGDKNFVGNEVLR